MGPRTIYQGVCRASLTDALQADARFRVIDLLAQVKYTYLMQRVLSTQRIIRGKHPSFGNLGEFSDGNWSFGETGEILSKEMYAQAIQSFLFYMKF